MNITKKCRECNLGYVIKDHIKLLIQLLTNILPQYNFRLQTTKCLNTAIMLMVFLLGEKALYIADYCDTRATIDRHQNGEDDNTVIINNLKKQLFSKKEKSRILYYILLTDGYFPKNSKQENIYFPGHVFILEKIWDNEKKEHYFYFFQSYINQYTLEQHIQQNKGLKISFDKAVKLIDNLDNILHSENWSNKNVLEWNEITFTNSSQFLDTNSRNKFYLCFKKAKITSCYRVLLSNLKRVRKVLEVMAENKENEIYGDATMYEDGSQPLTNKQVKEEVNILIEKIERNKNLSLKRNQ